MTFCNSGWYNCYIHITCMYHILYQRFWWKDQCFNSFYVHLLLGWNIWRPRYASSNWPVLCGLHGIVRDCMVWQHEAPHRFCSVIFLIKHRKNCECCPVSQLIVRYQRLSWIQVLNCQNCNQCLKCHKSPGLSFQNCQKIVSIVSVWWITGKDEVVWCDGQWRSVK